MLRRYGKVCFKLQHARFPFDSSFTINPTFTYNLNPTPSSKNLNSLDWFDSITPRKLVWSLNQFEDKNDGEPYSVPQKNSTTNRNINDVASGKNTRVNDMKPIHSTSSLKSGSASLTRQFLTDGHERAVNFNYKVTLYGYDPQGPGDDNQRYTKEEVFMI
ncbi:hypothetical protein DPMN_084240 [Dreissena polymorpha]|uniref:Uncharacterized protein n=1 Tax=Dreissena polymorpha TaxID=45954 RepID=A0A9D3YDY9_DREPO|nr:hypothetical protein DPMN_084240 [Dreissena polymorpha]